MLGEPGTLASRLRVLDTDLRPKRRIRRAASRRDQALDERLLGDGPGVHRLAPGPAAQYILGGVQERHPRFAPARQPQRRDDGRGVCAGPISRRRSLVCRAQLEKALARTAEAASRGAVANVDGDLSRHRLVRSLAVCAPEPSAQSFLGDLAGGDAVRPRRGPRRPTERERRS